jgi:PAS domain S-box-containing protein
VEAEWETMAGSRAFSSPTFFPPCRFPSHLQIQLSAATESRWEQLFEQSPLSLQIFAPDGRTIRFNPAWKKLFGLSDEEAYAFNVLESPDLHRVRRRSPDPQGVSRRGGLVSRPCRFPCAATRKPVRWIGGTVFPVITPDGILREVVVIHHDITELKEAEETMRRLNEILEERVASRTAELRSLARRTSASPSTPSASSTDAQNQLRRHGQP